jgi:hypothetical protein
MTSRNFEQFFNPSPKRHAFYYYGHSTVVTNSLTPLPLRPLRHLWTSPNKYK